MKLTISRKKYQIIKLYFTVGIIGIIILSILCTLTALFICLINFTSI
ncbi:MAG: hypothetical protein ACRCXY_02250 [Fusobacteriaceae bacterium]